jgi:hypothetical protein
MARTSLRSREAKMCDDMPNDLSINARALPTKPIEERMTTEDINGSWNTVGALINLCNGVWMKKRRLLAASDRKTSCDIRVGFARC